MGYVEADIIKMCDKAWHDVATFYQADCINYRGRTSDTGRYYSEIAAEYVLNRMEEFKAGIPMITRESCYDLHHDGSYREGTGRDEEVIAIKMFLQSQSGYKFGGIGTIIDYQTPLKNKRDDAAGKIDLLALNGEVLRILELKKPDSKETMLRCVLEGYTYLKTVNKEKLIKDFNLSPDTKVMASPFVFYKREQWSEWIEKRPMLMRLMSELESTPYFIKEQDGKFIVEED